MKKCAFCEKKSSGKYLIDQQRKHLIDRRRRSL